MTGLKDFFITGDEILEITVSKAVRIKIRLNVLKVSIAEYVKTLN